MNTTSISLVAGAGYCSPVPIQEAVHGSMIPTITAIPGNGGTILVQYTTTDLTVIQKNGTVNWNNWPSGTVSAYTSDSLVGTVTAVRAQATTANGTLEVCQ